MVVWEWLGASSVETRPATSQVTESIVYQIDIDVFVEVWHAAPPTTQGRDLHNEKSLKDGILR